VSDRPAERIRRAIAERGPITFAEFMEMALYGPDGFYEEPPVGESGHFVTSPHVHYVFGTMLANAMRSLWTELGHPVPFRLIELGAGDGTLARRLLMELEDVPLEYVAVERSAGAREALSRLPVRVAASLEVVEPHIVGCLFANELLDNLPFEWLRQTENGPKRILIDVEGDGFVQIERPWPEDLMEVLPDLTTGQEAAVSLEALRLVERAVRVLAHGFALFIDYGGGRAVQVHGYRNHRVVADILADPGSADITAGVDLENLARYAHGLGMRTAGPFSQRSALLTLGIAEWFEEQRKQQAELLDRRAGLEAVRTFGGRSRASLLVDPNGLGGMQWLLLATPECEWPGWALGREQRD
jgi:SAM-dependent MidA family methyltransferase